MGKAISLKAVGRKVVYPRALTLFEFRGLKLLAANYSQALAMACKIEMEKDPTLYDTRFKYVKDDLHEVT